MSEETGKTTVLTIVIDQQKALTDLENTTKNLLNLKEAQTNLAKAYKDGTIDQDQFAKSKVQLDNAIKSETQSRNALTQAVNANNNSMNAQKVLLKDLIDQRNNLDRSTSQGVESFDRLNKKILELNNSLKASESAGGNFGRNVGNYPEKLDQFAKATEVAGVNVGELGEKFKGLLNPALAVGAAITAIGAAYESSAAGSKDFEEAANRLKAEFAVAAGNLGGDVQDSGQGFFASGIDRTLNNAKDALALLGGLVKVNGVDLDKVLEKNKQDVQATYEAYNKIKELQFEQLQNEVKASQLRREAYELTVLRNNTEANIYDRQAAAQKIVENLVESQDKSVEVLKKQVDQMAIIGEHTHNEVTDEKNTSDLRKDYLSALVRINEEEASREKKISAAKSAEEGITREILKQQAAASTAASKLKYKAPTNNNAPDFNKDFDVDPEDAAEKKKRDNQKELQANQEYIDSLNDQRRKELADLKGYGDEKNRIYVGDADNYAKSAKEIRQITRDKERQAQETVNVLKSTSRLTGQLLGQQSSAYKVFASGETLVSTYFSAQKAFESQFLPEADETSPIRGAIAAAAAVIEGLANVAAIDGIHFARGGYTGTGGTYDVAGAVHKNEYVVPSKVYSNPDSTGHIRALENMRTGFADGGFTTNSMTNPINMNQSVADAYKNMPPINVSWKEGLLVDSRIRFKENLTSA